MTRSSRAKPEGAVDDRYFHIMLNMVDFELDPFQYRLLGHYRRVCGKDNKGVCFELTRTTANTCRMSPSKVSGTRWQLVDLGYIEIHECDGSEAFAVTVVDRMAENIKYCENRSPQEQFLDNCSPQEQNGLSQEQTCSPDEQNRSPRALEEEPSKKEPTRKNLVEESLTRESQPQTEEREIDLPFAIRSRVNDYSDFAHYKAGLIKEIDRLGVEKAVAILEERCFGRPDVRSWKYMLTTLRNEPPLEDEFVAIMQASAKAPVPVEVESSAPPVAPKAEAPAPPPSTPAPKPVDPVLPAAKPKPLVVEAAPVDELSPEHDWHVARRLLCSYLGKLNHEEAQAAQAALNSARFGGYEDGVFKLIAPNADSKALLDQLHRQIFGEMRRQAKNFAKAVEIEVN